MRNFSCKDDLEASGLSHARRELLRRLDPRGVVRREQLSLQNVQDFELLDNRVSTYNDGLSALQLNL